MQLSVIIPFFNDHPFLDEALASVRKHVCPSHEIILVDDNSPDKDYIENLNKAQLKTVQLTENLGAAGARNAGLQVASGDYILFLDSDDLIYQSPIEMLATKASDGLRHEYPDIIAGSFIDKRNSQFAPKPLPLKTCLKKDPWIAKLHDFSTCLYRRQFLIEHKIEFNQLLTHGEDTLFLALAISCAQRITITDHAFYRYRHRQNSLTKSPYNMKKLNARIQYFQLITDIFHNHDDAKIIRLIRAMNWNIQLANKILRDLGKPSLEQLFQSMHKVSKTELSLAKARHVSKIYNIYLPLHSERVIEALITGNFDQFCALTVKD